MLFLKKSAELQYAFDAISRSQAVIEFNLDGTIITANSNFLNAMGYTLSEIQGKHHSMFVEPIYAKSAEYAEFWRKLNQGEYDAAEYKRLGKGGKEIWIQASYNPVLNAKGKPFKVIKFATDITQEKLKNADISGQLSAIDKAQAVIQFNLDGTIITANSNFLNAVGYTLDEVSAVTKEISENMQSASTAVTAISNNIIQISDSVQRSAKAVSSTKQAAQTLRK